MVKRIATPTASVVAIGCCRLDNVQNDGHRHESRSPSVRPQAGFSVLSIAIEHAQVRFNHVVTAWNIYFRRRFTDRAALHTI